MAIALCLGSAVAHATTYHFLGTGGNDWWLTTTNWDPTGIPNSTNDIVIFDESWSIGTSTNTHSPSHTVQQMIFNNSFAWRVHNSVHDVYLNHPTGNALVTQDGSGAVNFECDLRLDDDTVFGGTGTGALTVYGSITAMHSTYGPRHGVLGTAGLIKNSSYDLVLNNVASYQGPTTINSGRLLFNAESAKQNPNWATEPATPYVPVTMAPVTVNAGGTLGGTGILRAPVTANSGGTFAPGESAGIFTVASLALAAGSTTQMELGGNTPGNGAGFHDQAIVTGQLGLGGTLDVTLIGGHVPAKGSFYTIFQYGSQTGAFDTLNSPSVPGHPNYEFQIDCGTGTNGEVTLGVAEVHHFTGTGAANNDWWVTADNWDTGVEPGTVATYDDIVVFDDAHSPTRRSTNTHNKHSYVQEVRFHTSDSWQLHNSVWDIYLANPLPAAPAHVTQNGSGPVRFDCDLRLDEDTVFGGTGAGRVTVYGSQTAQHGTYGPRHGVYGTGALIKQGSYTLVLENVASHQGGTIINDGTLLFNAESAAQNPNWAAEPATPWVPVTQGPVVVNAGGTLGGTGILRAPVTVNSGGTFAPGESAGIFTVDSLTLAAGSTTQMELGSITAGNGTGFHDQAIVTGALSLGGTLDVVLAGGYVPTKGDTFAIMQYGSLDPAANSFDTVNYPALTGRPTNYQWDIDYGTGTSSEVTLSVNAMPWYYTGANPTQDYWVPDIGIGNWNYPGKPGVSAADGDVAIFDENHTTRKTTNIHSMGPAYLKELRVITNGTWQFYNSVRDIALNHPTPGESALLTKEGSGVVTFDCDIRLDDDAVFGGGGGGRIVINGSQTSCHVSYGPRYGLTGTGGLTLDGAYTVVVNNVANYQGPTVLNNGTLLFNADSAAPTSSWAVSDPATWYEPVQMAQVTVNAGGTLGGTGILRAPVTVAGGTFSPGASAGIFTVDSLSLSQSATTLIELGGTTPGSGIGLHDQAVVNGMLGLGGTLTVELIDGFTPAGGDTFSIFTYGELEQAAGEFDAFSFPKLGDGLLWFIDYGTGAESSVTLKVNIPEPATLVLLGVGCAALARRRRRAR